MNAARIGVGFAFLLLNVSIGWTQSLEPIRVSDDGTHFVLASTGTRFVVWGVNYDHDEDGRLLDEYWVDQWQTVVDDFREIKELGANCVRIHLQLGKFMDAPDQPNATALQQLGRLIALAEATGLYLDITGLACYHQKNIPAWYDELEESKRWAVQAAFWKAVAQTCQSSPAVFCYDLMNEPILPGKVPETEWLTGELGGKFFVQRIALDAQGRDRAVIAASWVNQLTKAIREHDQDHLVTVGVIPWIFVFGQGEPLFYSAEVGRSLDFVAVHFYPERGKIDQAVAAAPEVRRGQTGCCRRNVSAQGEYRRHGRIRDEVCHARRRLDQLLLGYHIRRASCEGNEHSVGRNRCELVGQV